MNERRSVLPCATSPLEPLAVPRDLHPLVYFIGAELKCGVPVKIGTTRNVSERLGTLARSSPVPLLLQGILIGSYEQEKELHVRFAKQRLHGEWFRITPSLRDLILASRAFYDRNLQILSSRAQRQEQAA